MSLTTRIKDLFKKHDYAPTVLADGDGDGCVLTMPHPVLTRPGEDRCVVRYRVERGREVQGVSCETQDGLRWLIPCPEYAARLLVQTDVANRCGRLPVGVNTVVYLDGGGNEHGSIDSVINPPSDAVAEDEFLDLFIEAQLGGFTAGFGREALERGFAQGYNLCKSYLQKD